MGTIFATDVDVDQLLSTWSAGSGPSDEEIIEYATAMSEELDKPEMIEEFRKNVEQAGVWANEVDESFSKVSLSFVHTVEKNGKDFPKLVEFKDQCVGYKKRWAELLAKSRDVASKNVLELTRFEDVFLALVELIETDKDREEAIKELESFSKEPDEDSEKLYQGFQDLKRDIVDFVKRFYEYIEDEGTKLDEKVKKLNGEIGELTEKIEVLDGKIKQATDALIATGGLLLPLGAIVAGSFLAKYQSERRDIADELIEKQNDLLDINRQQRDLAYLKTEFDGLQPSFFLICEKLIMFAGIWSTVRSLSVQFAKQLRVLEGVPMTNTRFRLEVNVAKKACLPLRDGLRRYAAVLENFKA